MTLRFPSGCDNDAAHKAGVCPVTPCFRPAAAPGAAALLLISPWVDMELSSDTFDTNAVTDVVFTRNMVQGLVKVYLQNGESPADPVGSRTWFAGRTTCLAFAAPSMGEPGDWRMVPAGANDQPAAMAWFCGEPFGIAVLTPAEDGIARITLFGDPSLVERFQLKGPLEQV